MCSIFRRARASDFIVLNADGCQTLDGDQIKSCFGRFQLNLTPVLFCKLHLHVEGVTSKHKHTQLITFPKFDSSTAIKSICVLDTTLTKIIPAESFQIY